MFSHLPFKPEDLDQFLVKVREDSPFRDLQANPFFYLVKPTEENLLKYKIRQPESYFCLIIDFLAYLPTTIYEIAKSLILSILLMNQTRDWKIEASASSKYLFLSHFTHAQDPRKDDIFFGNNLNSPKSFTLYLNHTRLSSIRIQNTFRTAGKTNIAINSKTLMPLPLLNLQFKQIKTSCWILFEAMGNKSLVLSERRLLIRAAILQHSRATIANLVLRERLAEILQSVNPEFVVLTIEGHSHEAMVLHFRETSFANVRIIGIQHAPLVPAQSNFFRNIKLLRSDDYLLTSGESTKNLIKNKENRFQLEVLGSPKSRNCTFQAKDASKLTVLLAPEGTQESLLRFTDMAKKLSELMPQVAFIIRAHPALGSIASKIAFSKLLSRSNITTSISLLADDLKMSHLVLFQSSAIGIEGLSFGAFPIHVNFEGNDSLNPLVGTGIPLVSLRTIEEIETYISNFSLAQAKDEKFQRECFSHFSNYFANLKNLDSVIG